MNVFQSKLRECGTVCRQSVEAFRTRQPDNMINILTTNVLNSRNHFVLRRAMIPFPAIEKMTTIKMVNNTAGVQGSDKILNINWGVCQFVVNDHGISISAERGRSTRILTYVGGLRNRIIHLQSVCRGFIAMAIKHKGRGGVA